jgi:hypothetical protein
LAEQRTEAFCSDQSLTNGDAVRASAEGSLCSATLQGGESPPPFNAIDLIDALRKILKGKKSVAAASSSNPKKSGSVRAQNGGGHKGKLKFLRSQ